LIRKATAEDIPRMVEMGRRFREESTYSKYMADNPECMTKLGENLLKCGGILVIEESGALVGMLGWVLHDHFISGERFAGEVFWWVEPEHRGDGIKLLNAAKAESKAAGAKYMQMIAPTKRIAAAYRHMGFEFVESTYQIAL
jgi:GNAT superfamily N-acetyltransferase